MATEPQSSSSPHTKGGKSPVCGHLDLAYLCRLYSPSCFVKHIDILLMGSESFWLKLTWIKMWFRAHTGTPRRPCHSLSPWNSQAGIEGSPQDVLEGSTGISSDRNSVDPSARRPSKIIQRKQQQLQKTNSLIRLHSLKNRISLFWNTNSIFSSNISSNGAYLAHRCFMFMHSILYKAMYICISL